MKIYETVFDHSEILLSDKVKIFIPVSAAYYHFMLETATSISVLAKENPGCVFLFFNNSLQLPEWKGPILSDLLNKLSNLYGTSHIYLDSGSYSIKNLGSYFKGNPNHAEDYVDDLYKSFNNNRARFSSPHRLVYISRVETMNDYNQSASNIKFRTRLKDEELIEEYFKSSGYEIVYAESLSIGERIKLFRETKVLAGVTGAGLCNMIFMQPGSTVININSYLQQKLERRAVHSGLYSKMAFHKNILFVSIPGDGETSAAAIKEITRHEKIIRQVAIG
jgi:hypothetical protein